MTQAKTDQHLSDGFDDGNYANAYETQNYNKAIARLSMNRSDAYIVAFTLGFFAAYELDEMGEHEYTYLDAYHSTYGQRCVELGYVDALDSDCGSCHDHNADQAY